MSWEEDSWKEPLWQAEGNLRDAEHRRTECEPLHQALVTAGVSSDKVTRGYKDVPIFEHNPVSKNKRF